MKVCGKYKILFPGIALLAILFTSFSFRYSTTGFRFPYKSEGLTDRQAAAHLLSRFTYGIAPGDIDAVVKEGLENWFKKQLDAQLPEDTLNKMLQYVEYGNSNTDDILQHYLNNYTIVKFAARDSVLNMDSALAHPNDYKAVIKQYMLQHNLKYEYTLPQQIYNQKVIRAVYSQNQLREVMTDFWFNHFNVSMTKFACVKYIPAYETEALRPNALGKFNDLLVATAQSPAMLVYLDNFASRAPFDEAALKRRLANLTNSPADSTQRVKLQNALKKSRNTPGLNENYAREIMELHTLGVNGGYTQQDVTQAALVLTGWTAYSPYADLVNAKATLQKIGEDGYSKAGIVMNKSGFLFLPDRHDKTEKVVLGKHFGPNGGYQEGLDLLHLLAHHPSTAQFISRKLAVHFVSDNPPPALIKKMAKAFLDSDGDIKQVLITMVSSREFWSKDALREKVKSPLELATGAVRGLNAKMVEPFHLSQWITRMGEKLYYYSAPTGYPDKGMYWINTGSLLNRMNFGLELANNHVGGIKVNLLALNQNHEPESAQAALVTYGQLIMPERNLDATVKRLSPLLNEPELAAKVQSANQRVASSQPGNMGQAANPIPPPVMDAAGKAKAQSAMLAQVVGVIIGSPEYQRR